MAETYRIEFTDLARNVAALHGGLPAVEDKIRQEIAGLLEDRLESIADLLFHTVGMDEEYRTVFICSPADRDGETVLEVDTASYEDQGELDAGPLAGKSIMMPVRDSE